MFNRIPEPDFTFKRVRTKEKEDFPASDSGVFHLADFISTETSYRCSTSDLCNHDHDYYHD